jgi:hypothetical protein
MLSSAQTACPYAIDGKSIEILLASRGFTDVMPRRAIDWKLCEESGKAIMRSVSMINGEWFLCGSKEQPATFEFLITTR